MLNFDLLYRARIQEFLGLPITGEFLDNVDIYRREGTIYVEVKGEVVASTSNKHSVQHVCRCYEALSGKTLTLARHRSLAKVSDVKETSDAIADQVGNIHMDFIVFEALDALGVSYLLED